MSAVASHQTPLRKLTALPRPLAGFKGPLCGRRGMEGRTRGGEGGERENGEGRGIGEDGGNSALVVGG